MLPKANPDPEQHLLLNYPKISNMRKIKILLAEDDPNLGMLTKEYLIAKDFECTLAENGQLAFEAYKKNSFDMLITDVMMPQMDGFTLAENIRQVDKKIPIIFLTVKSMKEDVLKGLKIGADDYIRKPFHMEELLLRINAILKRVADNLEKSNLKIYKIGQFTFDYDRQILKHPEGDRKLSSKESDTLKILCDQVNEVVERSYILTHVWGNDDYFAGRSMDVYITKLRKYLKADPGIELMNVHGLGFKLLAN